MLVTTRAMGMAVFGFIFSCFAYACYLHVEGQLLAGQRVIAINIHIEAADLEHGYLHRTLLGLQVQDLTRQNFADALEPF